MILKLFSQPNQTKPNYIDTLTYYYEGTRYHVFEYYYRHKSNVLNYNLSITELPISDIEEDPQNVLIAFIEEANITLNGNIVNNTVSDKQMCPGREYEIHYDDNNYIMKGMTFLIENKAINIDVIFKKGVNEENIDDFINSLNYTGDKCN